MAGKLKNEGGIMRVSLITTKKALVVFCFMIGPAAGAANVFADPPVSFGKIISIYGDTRIRDLRQREENLKGLIRRNKISFIPTPEVKTQLRGRGIPQSVLDELNQNFTGRIEYSLSKINCPNCRNNIDQCEATRDFQIAVEEQISRLAIQNPELWLGKGVSRTIRGCNEDSTEHGPRVIVDVDAVLRREGNGFKLVMKLSQRDSDLPLYLGEASATVSVITSDGFRAAAEVLKKYIDDVFVRQSRPPNRG